MWLKPQQFWEKNEARVSFMTDLAYKLSSTAHLLQGNTEKEPVYLTVFVYFNGKIVF